MTTTRDLGTWEPRMPGRGANSACRADSSLYGGARPEGDLELEAGEHRLAVTQGRLVAKYFRQLHCRAIQAGIARRLCNLRIAGEVALCIDACVQDYCAQCRRGAVGGVDGERRN